MVLATPATAAALGEPPDPTRNHLRWLYVRRTPCRIGGYAFVLADRAYFFPLGVPDLFVEAYAPAPYIETVNTLAFARYAMQMVLDWDKGVEIKTQQNVLPLCTIPAC